MEAPNKKIRLSGGARRLIKEKEKAVKGNQSILSFLKSNSQEPSLEYNRSEEEDNPPTLPTPDIITEHNILPPASFLKEELLIQTSYMLDDSKHKQADLIPFNDNIPQMDNCSSSQTNKQIELAQNVSYSTLIDRCHDYQSDPYLFIDTVLTPQIIRTLVEIGPYQPGFNSNNYVFEENECGKKFSPNCYQWSNPNKGVSNFRKGNEKIIKHEKSKDHRDAENEYLILKSRISKDKTIQQNLMKVQKSQIEFNRSVLKRLIDLSLFLSTNGLPFRGHREDINQDTQSKGLFIKIVKLVSKYNAVLAKHLAESNRNETYLSPKIQNDILKCMADETLHKILNEVKQAKYFTIIVDSTIDIGRIDQFSFSLRFVDQQGDIKEHFLCFEATANDYFVIIKKLMEEYKLDISLCCGQAYDGANTMSGRFSGLQSKIKDVSPLALYIHCCAHNLNLVLIDSIRSSINAVSFFGILEALYTFITNSLPRLKIFEEQKKIDGLVLTLKQLSETRWASHKRVVDSVYINLPAIVTSLKRISDGELLNIKLKTISEAQGLLFQIMNFKFSFLLVLWKNILEKVNILSNYLQNSKIDLITAHDMVSTCFLDISSLRNEEHFLKIKCNATELCGQFGGNNNFEQGRIITKKKIHGENNLENIIESADENFKCNTYFVILDSFTNTLKHCFEDFSNIVKKFEVLNPKKMSKENIDENIISIQNLSTFYNVNVDEVDIEVKYRSFCLVYHQVYDEVEPLKLNEVLKFMISRDMVSSYPNLYTLYKIFYTLPVSSATAERSFSRLKLLKTYLSSTMTEDLLSNLAILSIESNTAETINFNKVISTFVSMKKCRKLL
ncbi:hypothetical protein QTP88_016421 [Uroleucon formosanum]